VHFPLEKFQQFASELVIQSKELGNIKLDKPNGAQRLLIRAIAVGLEDDIHHFVVLKSRQLGATTICAALDLFWHYSYPGTQGTFAAHTEEARDNFRQMLNTYHDGLPKSHRVKMTQNNRYFIAWANRSKLAMQIGGSEKKAGGKGRGLGLSYCHATECSSWNDEESLASILASLAETNPLRLYLFESTARGYNLFHEMWKDAQHAVTQRAVFIGWWLNEFYRKEKDSPEYKTYWTGELTPNERDWVRAVKLLYGCDLVPEQIAWWRWLLAEKIHDENLLMQDFPPTERHAFILTGQNFFSLSTVDELEQRIDAENERAHFYRFKLGEDFMDTRCEETIANMAHFTIWEMPDPAAHYSIGADPAFGSSDWADAFCLQVYRCYADRFEQVAEFCTSQLKAPYQFAWIVACVCGLYRNSRLNMEINGPGEAVQNELNNLRRKASSIPSRGDQMTDAQYKAICDNRSIMRDTLGMMKYYLYRRLDSPYGGVGAYHTLATNKMKHRMCGALNDLVEKREAVIRSRELVEEMKIFVRDEGTIAAQDRGKDDRVIASSLAAVQYVEGMKIPLEQMGFSYAREMQRRGRFEETGQAETPNDSALSRSVKGYLKRVGIE
jgi:hypothetical protein